MLSDQQLAHSTPDTWRLAAGGPDDLRLPGRVATIGAALGLGLAILVAGLGKPEEAPWSQVVISCTLTIATVWLVAALTARWLGSRMAILAGFVQLTSTGVLMAGWNPIGQTCFQAALTIALGAFAVANLPGRLPRVEHRWTRWIFYAACSATLLLAGPAGPVMIVSACALYLLITNDNRGGRFFIDLPGMAIGIAGVLLTLVLPQPWLAMIRTADPYHLSLVEVLLQLGVGLLPWTPLVLLALAVGIWAGYYASPFWRLLACWVAGPLLWIALGWFRAAPHVDALMPPLSVIAAGGLWEIVRFSRRWRRRPRQPKESTGNTESADHN